MNPNARGPRNGNNRDSGAVKLGGRKVQYTSNKELLKNEPYHVFSGLFFFIMVGITIAFIAYGILKQNGAI